MKSNTLWMRIDPQRQTCKVCGHADKFNFHVPDHIWRAVVPYPYRQLVVCLSCFDEFARQRQVDYAPFINELLFVGDRAHFAFKPIRTLTIDDD
ncbi:MAG: hypothetical protein M1343_08115 [Chloroflexi bacterium]|nr:hypothetical protein [Chloroflexota bacterium]